MKHRLLLLLLVLSTLSSIGQSLKKIPIQDPHKNSGCAVYAFCQIPFTLTKSQDSADVYLGDCTLDNLTYGVICVKLGPDAVLTDLNASEALLISYMDYLKANFSITQAAGYGKGHTLRNNENTRGVVDYWEDAEKNKWKVKGWTNNDFICVLFVYSKLELPEQKIDAFLNGLVFPASGHQP